MKDMVKGLVDAAHTHKEVAKHHDALAAHHEKGKTPLSEDLHVHHHNLARAEDAKAEERHKKAKHLAAVAKETKGVVIPVGDAPKKGEKITIPAGDGYARQDAAYISRMGALHSKLAAVNAQIAQAARGALEEDHDKRVTPLIRAAIDHHSEAADSDAEAARHYMKEAGKIAKQG